MDWRDAVSFLALLAVLAAVFAFAAFVARLVPADYL